MIRVILPQHLRTLAKVEREITLSLDEPATLASLLSTIETHYPMLRGTIRSQTTLERRPFIRFFACGQDLSHEPPETPLPEAVVKGSEPFRIVGALAGG